MRFDALPVITTDELFVMANKEASRLLKHFRSHGMETMYLNIFDTSTEVPTTWANCLKKAHLHCRHWNTVVSSLTAEEQVDRIEAEIIRTQEEEDFYNHKLGQWTGD